MIDETDVESLESFPDGSQYVCALGPAVAASGDLCIKMSMKREVRSPSEVCLFSEQESRGSFTHSTHVFACLC